ncbi:DUF3983 domain-containing protein [Peribacillus asahii]
MTNKKKRHLRNSLAKREKAIEEINTDRAFKNYFIKKGIFLKTKSN